jgi:biopolymer transport protein ExbD
MARKIPEINSGSMADISFLLLTFFLLTSSINTDMGISRKLPPPIDKTVTPPEIKKRNIFTVLVNANDQLMVNGSIGDISTIKAKTIEFLSNPASDPNLPEKIIKYIDLLGNIEVSKGVISLQNDRGTSYEMYIQVQNELTAAVNELRDQLSKEKFGKKFEDLKSDAKKEAIQKAIPVSISEAEPKNIGGQK